jgi:hypothetical protein
MPAFDLFSSASLSANSGQAHLLAYVSDGQPMSAKQRVAGLVVPGDKRGGRFTSSVRSIELKDLAPAQRDAIRVQLLVADGNARIASLSGLERDLAYVRAGPGRE